MLAHDAVIRDRGNLMSAVETNVTAVRNWEGHLNITEEPHAQHALPLAGFAVIEAECVQEVVALVSNTPCARARGVIEIRPLREVGDAA
jgi:hypothetical protein